MTHYIAVIVPHAEVGWRAYFPDFCGCRAEAREVDVAIVRASNAACELVGKLLLNGGPPTARTLEEIRADEAWAAEQKIDWTKALISVVPVPCLSSPWSRDATANTERASTPHR